MANQRTFPVFFQFVLLSLLALSTISCEMNPKMTDVTDNPQYWGGYQPGHSYRLKKSVFIFDGQELGWVLVNPMGQVNHLGPRLTVPPSIESYIADPDKWPDVLGIVQEGTILQVNRMVVWSRPPYSTEILVYAVISSKSLIGKEVEISLLSTPLKSGFELEPKSEVLEEIDNGEI